MAWILSLSILILAVYLYTLKSPIDPKSFSYPNPPPRLEGPLAVNNKLQNAKRLFENDIFAPESFTADKNGNIYTGTGDGKIYKIENGVLKEIAKTGQSDENCGKPELETKCGRPNAVRIDAEGNLIVADAYKGLLKVSLPSGQIEILHSADIGIGGVPFKFLNGLEIAKDGKIYFTDSTSKWNRRYNRMEILEMNSLGRLLMYDPQTKKTHLLLTNMSFPNGIVLTKDENALLINELTPSRIVKFHLKGSKKGETEVIQNNLPGYPDNIRRNSKGTYYVGMSHTRFETWNPLHKFLDIFGPYPGIRKVLAKMANDYFYDLCLPKHSIIVEINEEGNIISSLHDPEAKIIQTVTDAFEHQGKLYIGSFAARFVGQLDLS